MCIFSDFLPLLIKYAKKSQKREKTSQNFRKACWFIFISNNHSVLYHIQHFFRQIEFVYPLVRKDYSNFYTLQLSNFFAMNNNFFISLFISILCGTRYWRDFHKAQLINKSTTYNNFERSSNTTIRWYIRFTANFKTNNCQRIFELKKRRTG